jgi:hypothetical protein
MESTDAGSASERAEQSSDGPLLDTDGGRSRSWPSGTEIRFRLFEQPIDRFGGCGTERLADRDG